MNRLDDINVCVEGISWKTQNALPLLHEIRHALANLLTDGQETTIDLQSLPMGPADEARLFEVLGRGEVEAQLNALGNSLIWETGIPGVWLIEHFNADQQLVAKLIEVTAMPSILKSQPEDIREGLVKLSERLATDEGT